MNNFKFIKIFTLVLVTLLHFEINAQGTTTLLEGHHLTEVVLTSYGNTLTSKIKQLKYAIPNRAGEIPGNVGKYGEDGIVMSGIMSEAVLAIDWWTLFGEPTEHYIFTWLARDYYNLVVPSEYGVIEKTVTKSKLQKYPDLLMRFEALKPIDIAFEIYWTFTDETRNSYYKQTGSFFESSFSNQEFKTKVSSASILTEPSGKVPFAVPGIRQGKGREFFGLTDDYPEDKLETLLKLFAKANSFWIYKVEVTKIIWPIHEMKAIAELYEKYEKGEVDPSPIQLIENELQKSQNLTNYNKKDFWNDAYENDIKTLETFFDNQKSIIGIKTNNKITYQRERTGFLTELIKIPKTRNYFLDVSLDHKTPITNRLIKIIDNQGRKIVFDEIPYIFDYRILEDGNLYLYKKLNSFTKVKFGQFKNLDTDSSGKLKSYLLAKGYLLGEFTTNRNQLEKTIRDLLFESTNSYLKGANQWWGVGEFMEYKLNQNLEVIGTRIVYYIHYQ